MSDISSVIEAAKAESRSEQAKAAENDRGPQIAGPKHVEAKQACFWHFLKAAAVIPYLPASTLLERLFEIRRQRIDVDAFTGSHADPGEAFHQCRFRGNGRA